MIYFQGNNDGFVPKHCSGVISLAVTNDPQTLANYFGQQNMRFSKEVNYIF